MLDPDTVIQFIEWMDKGTVPLVLIGLLYIRAKFARLEGSIDELRLDHRKLGERLDGRIDEQNQDYRKLGERLDRRFDALHRDFRGLAEQVAEIRGSVLTLLGLLQNRILLKEPEPATTTPAE